MRPTVRPHWQKPVSTTKSLPPNQLAFFGDSANSDIASVHASTRLYSTRSSDNSEEHNNGHRPTSRSTTQSSHESPKARGSNATPKANLQGQSTHTSPKSYLNKTQRAPQDVSPNSNGIPTQRGIESMDQDGRADSPETRRNGHRRGRRRSHSELLSDIEEGYGESMADQATERGRRQSESTKSSKTTTSPHLSPSTTPYESIDQVTCERELEMDPESSIFGIREAPVFRPSAEEFADPNEFLERVHSIVEQYGICRIVPPKEWNKDAWQLRIDPNKFSFNTKAQAVHTLQNRHGAYTVFIQRLQYYWTVIMKLPIKEIPKIDGMNVDLLLLYELVEKLGGYDTVRSSPKGFSVLIADLHLNPLMPAIEAAIHKVYTRYLLPFKTFLNEGGYIPPVPQEVKRATSTVSSAEPSLRSKRTRGLMDERTSSGIDSHVLPEQIAGLSQRTLERLARGDDSDYGPYGALDEPVDEKKAGEWRNVRANSFFPDNDVTYTTCYYCGRGDRPNTLLVCDTPGCLSGAHLECSQRRKVPSGDFFCPGCTGEASQPGFKQKRDKANAKGSVRRGKSMTSMTPVSTIPEKQRRQDAFSELDLDYSLGFGHGHGKEWSLREFREWCNKFGSCWFHTAAVGGTDDPLRHSDGSTSSFSSPTKISGASISSQSTPSRNNERDSSQTTFSSPSSIGGSPGSPAEGVTRTRRATQGQWASIDPMVVSSRKMEREYWRLVSSGDYLAQVHYGSDVDVAADGACSGFPLDVKGETVGPNCIEIPRWISESKGKNHLTVNGHSFTEKEVDYLRKHGWNLNSLPYVTLLRFANESIGGVSRPMMYIGSLFSSFCWHTEDNWLYSINYIHTGAPKRWYAISGPGAPKFERVLRAELPHLFDEEPQLLYQLTTTLDPAILRRHGVEICTTLQHEGEFVVTFPRAYHSGFNCGFNVAESVNFAAMRWLDWGIMAANEYRFVRSTVFPHEQFLWNLSMHAFEIKRLSVAKALRDQISLYCKFSEAAMQRLQAHGITRHYQFTKKHLVIILDENSHPVGVEEVKDAPNRITADTHINLKDYDGFEPEDPQCFVCGYDLFFHRVDCACRSPRLPRCLKHAEHPICHCTNSQKFMSYRYRKSSFKAILRTLEMVISLLSGNSPSKISVDEM